MSRKITKTPNTEPQMTRDLKSTRALVDKTNEATLEAWARLEGRSYQMHAGIILRRIAHLYRSQPEALERLGLLAALVAVA